jgi:hypothetical protein
MKFDFETSCYESDVVFLKRKQQLSKCGRKFFDNVFFVTILNHVPGPLAIDYLGV